MGTLLLGAAAVLVIYLSLQLLRTANPAKLARAVKIAGGVLSLAVAAFVGIRGQLAVAIPLGFFGAGLLGWAPFSNSSLGDFFGGKGASAGRTSSVRSRYLEMLLDHDSGKLTGRIISGTHAGRELDEFDLHQLVEIATAFDQESSVLLESYLDRRFPAWRHNTQGQWTGGQGGSTATGKMTNEEAYEILGLKPGATRAEISSAHRSLMKKLHPDQGGSTYLAARVNEAKDTLLRNHRS